MLATRIALGVVPGTVRRVARNATPRVIFRSISGAICRRNLTVTWTEVRSLIQKAMGRATVKTTWSVTLTEVRTKTRSETPHATRRGTPQVILGAKCGEVPGTKGQRARCLPVRAGGLE